MNDSYQVRVNDNMDFEILKDDIDALDSIKTSKKTFHILQNHKSFKAEIVSSDFYNKNYTIKINGNTYKIDISNNLDQLIKQMGFNFGSSKQINSIKAPMPGLILDIMVKEGQEVKEDDGLLILEAMKMENIISSPRDGVIKSINVSKTDAIDKGHLLIEFE